MDTKESNIFTYSMKGGLILGAILSVCMCLLLKFPATGMFMVLVMFIAFFKCVSYYMMAYDVEVWNYEARLGRLVSVGTYLSFFASLIAAAVLYIYLRWLDPSTFESIVQTYTQLGEQMQAQGAQQSMVEQLKYVRPVDMAFSSVWTFSLMGAVVSLVEALFWRNKRNKIKKN